MQHIQNLVLVGTSHIAQQSVDDVKDAVRKYKPKIIAIELDQKRMNALMHPSQRTIRISDIGKIGFKGFLFNILGAWLQRKLGKMVGLAPGSEMKMAVHLAKETNAMIALIDQDVHITLRKLSKELTFREKARLTKEMIFGMLFSRQNIKIDLRKVPPEKLIKKLTQRMKKEYPSLYKVLVEERNEYMAKGLYKIMNLYPEEKIVAIVGAGHEEDIVQLLKKRNDG